MFTQSETTNHLMHAEVMQAVIDFLETNTMQPSALSINHAGWVQAEFSQSAQDLEAAWRKLQRQQKIAIEEPVMIHGSSLRVKFRLQPQQPQPSQRRSPWRRLRGLVS